MCVRAFSPGVCVFPRRQGRRDEESISVRVLMCVCVCVSLESKMSLRLLKYYLPSTACTDAGVRVRGGGGRRFIIILCTHMRTRHSTLQLLPFQDGIDSARTGVVRDRASRVYVILIHTNFSPICRRAERCCTYTTLLQLVYYNEPASELKVHANSRGHGDSAL